MRRQVARRRWEKLTTLIKWVKSGGEREEEKEGKRKRKKRKERGTEEE